MSDAQSRRMAPGSSVSGPGSPEPGPPIPEPGPPIPEPGSVAPEPGSPVLYFDLGSPYAYLAVMRVHSLFEGEVALQPVLLGAIFAHRGWGSWALTDARAANVAEIERRAAAYRLPLRWPPDWPPNSLTAQRAAIFAQRRGVGRAFTEAVYLATYGRGGDLGDPETILAAGQAAGMSRAELAAAPADPEIKAALREATDAAIALGVAGVPTLRLDGELYFGDDKLEEVAAA